MELQQTGLEPIGTWSILDSLNLTRVAEISESANPLNVMANKTFVVTSAEASPYTMLAEEVAQMDGNARFEGFAVDLFKHISEFLQFNVTFKLVDDGSYGSMDEHGNWNGMIREVMDGVQEGGKKVIHFRFRPETVFFRQIDLNLSTYVMNSANVLLKCLLKI